MSQTPLIFIIAGEASGDQLGAHLMADLSRERPFRFVGIGGPAMEAQGLSSLFPMEDLSHMGITSILKALPLLRKRLKFTLKTVTTLNPDLVLTIDAPEFNFRILKALHKRIKRPRLIHCVAPTVWAWRPKRAQKVARFMDHLLCIYPCEPPYFEKYGLPSTFVGHPIAAKAWTHEKRVPNLICVLPGSRLSEVKRLLPLFKEALLLLQKEFPELKVIIPTLPHLKNFVSQEVQRWPFPVTLGTDEKEKLATFQKATLALAASGTIALELAQAQLPCVIAYKIGPFSAWIARRLLTTPWVSMVNILLQKEAVPECIQENCTPQKLAFALSSLLKNKKAYEDQQQAMAKALSLLKGSGPKAADVILGEIPPPQMKKAMLG